MVFIFKLSSKYTSKTNVLKKATVEEFTELPKLKKSVVSSEKSMSLSVSYPRIWDVVL